jgi:hypothetical protein
MPLMCGRESTTGAASAFISEQLASVWICEQYQLGILALTKRLISPRIVNRIAMFAS